MSIKRILGVALLCACLILIILFATRVDNFDVTIAGTLTAIGSFLGAIHAINNQTPHS